MLRLLMMLSDGPCQDQDPGLASPSSADLELAIARAVRRVESDPVLASISIQIVKKVYAGDALNASVKLLRTLEDEAKNGGIDAVIGPACSRACESTAVLTGARNLPQISFGCQSTTLSSKDQYPTVCAAMSVADG